MKSYDVFLSHANADKPAVEALARRLREDGSSPSSTSGISSPAKRSGSRTAGVWSTGT